MISLRQFTAATNAENIERILSDEVVARPIGFPYGESAKHKIEAELDLYVNSSRIIYEILEDGKVIGFVGFHDATRFDKIKLRELGVFGQDQSLADSMSASTLEVSFALDKDHMGKGIGPVAIKNAIEKAFVNCRCACVVAKYAIFADTGENVRCHKLLDRLGFTPYAIYSRVPMSSGDKPSAQACYFLNPTVQKVIDKHNEETKIFNEKRD